MMEEQALRLSGGICYERYGETVYLRQIERRRDYLFNAVAYDILRCFSGGPRTCAQVCAALEERCGVPDAETLRQDIEAFLKLLEEEGILRNEAAAPPFPEPSVSAQVQTLCAQDHRLFSAALELTYRCNARCVHCYADDLPSGREELAWEEYHRLLEELRALGCVSLLLTGGEVFCKDCFLRVAEHAAALGMAVDIFTNGLALTPERFDALRAMEPNSISYSLYGGTSAVHDAVTGIPGSFQRTLAAVMMTKCAGIDTYIKTVVMKENLEDLESLLQLGRRLGIAVSAGFAVLDTHQGRSGTVHQLTNPADLRRALALLERERPFAKEPAPSRTPEDPLCAAGLCALSVDPYGEVHPCLALPESLGNIRETSLRQIWESAPREPWRLQDLCGRCGSCRSVDFCEFCPGRVKPLPGGGTAVPENVCALAEVSRQLYYDHHEGE